MATVTAVEDDEGNCIDTCEDERCSKGNGSFPKLWHCVRCDSTYCKYGRQLCSTTTEKAEIEN
jgi:hypothetical protein